MDQLRTLKNEAPEAAGLSALIFEEDASRWYPYGEMLSQVLGLTNVDSVGQSGLESRYDAVLAGVAGSYLHQVDARNRTLAGSESYYTASSPGATLKLTIDATLQQICEKVMRECMEVNQAESVLCLISDVKTGAILAMCMRPDYDPNEPPRDDVETLTDLMRITAISDVYEPGSTFKILTASAALDSGVTTPEDSFYCSAKITVDGDTIRCWDSPMARKPWRKGCKTPVTRFLWSWPCAWVRTRFTAILRPLGWEKPPNRFARGERGAADWLPVCEKCGFGAHRLWAKRGGDSAAADDGGQCLHPWRQSDETLPGGGHSIRRR